MYRIQYPIYSFYAYKHSGQTNYHAMPWQEYPVISCLHPYHWQIISKYNRMSYPDIVSKINLSVFIVCYFTGACWFQQLYFIYVCVLMISKCDKHLKWIIMSKVRRYFVQAVNNLSSNHCISRCSSPVSSTFYCITSSMSSLDTPHKIWSNSD